MEGGREFLRCGACKKRYTYWLKKGESHPKVKCYYCGVESYPQGQPPPAPAKAPAPTATSAPTPAAAPVG